VCCFCEKLSIFRALQAENKAKQLPQSFPLGATQAAGAHWPVQRTLGRTCSAQSATGSGPEGKQAKGHVEAKAKAKAEAKAEAEARAEARDLCP